MVDVYSTDRLFTRASLKAIQRDTGIGYSSLCAIRRYAMQIIDPEGQQLTLTEDWMIALIGQLGESLKPEKLPRNPNKIIPGFDLDDLRTESGEILMPSLIRFHDSTNGITDYEDWIYSRVIGDCNRPKIIKSRIKNYWREYCIDNYLLEVKEIYEAKRRAENAKQAHSEIILANHAGVA